MSKVKGEMHKLLVDSEAFIVVTVNETVQENELFLLGGDVFKNCTPHTSELCKSPQNKVIASNDERHCVAGIMEEDLTWFSDQGAQRLEVDVEVQLSCCAQKCMGYWCATCEDMGKNGLFFISDDNIKIYK